MTCSLMPFRFCTYFHVWLALISAWVCWLFCDVLFQRTEIESRTLLRRLGTVGDMAATAAFLASDDSSYITGETIVVAGGMKSRL